MKAAAYIRVSTENQVGEDRYGLASQRADIEAYAAREGHEICLLYTSPSPRDRTRTRMPSSA